MGHLGWLSFGALLVMCLLMIVVGLSMDRMEQRNRDDDFWQDEGWDE